MTATIVQRPRGTAADSSVERVSLETLAGAQGPAIHGTLLLLLMAWFFWGSEWIVRLVSI